MHTPAEPAERSRPGMSTDRITAAALQIVDTEGSQALTMRRLGQALDRKMMTLYRYVPSKDALLAGVVARVLTDLAINPAAADWRQELRDFAASFRGLALAHPNAVPLLVTRPLTSPLGQRPPATLRPPAADPEAAVRGWRGRRGRLALAAGAVAAAAVAAAAVVFGVSNGSMHDQLSQAQASSQQIAAVLTARDATMMTGAVKGAGTATIAGRLLLRAARSSLR